MVKEKKQKKDTSNFKKSKDSQNDTTQKLMSEAKNWICWPVLVFSLIIVLPVISSAIFPGLIHSSFSSFSSFEFYKQIVNPFEVGELGGIIIVSNLIILGIGVIYYKKKMNLKKLFDFEISNKVAWIIVLVILSGYTAVTVNEISIPEPWGDFAPIKERIEKADRVDRWPIEEFLRGNENYSISEPHVKFTFLYFSLGVFENMKVLPFIASIALLLITYVLTTKITNKRIAGILALILVLQSSIFLTYDTSPTYSNFWIVFYLVSLWLILKKWELSHVSFVVSIFSKALSAAFLPLTMFFIFRNTSSKKRLYLLGSFGILIILGLGLYSLISSESDEGHVISENFWKGLSASAVHLRFDPIILIFILPLTITLFFKSRAGFLQADSLQVFIGGVLLISALLSIFTTQTNEPYRLMPLVVFFAIGAGSLLAKIKKPDELLSR